MPTFIIEFYDDDNDDDNNDDEAYRVG